MMWKKLSHPAPFYVLFCDKAGYSIYLTNFVKMWSINVPTDQGLMRILKDSNDGLEFTDENEFLVKGKHMLHTMEKMKDVKVTIDVNELAVLSLLTMEYNFPFRMKINLLKSSDAMFFDMVTQRLLKSINDLKKSQEDLYLKLKKKDMELERYRDEEIKISKHLRSEDFDEEEHNKKHSTYEMSFNTPYVPEILLEPHWHKKIVIDADTKIVKLLKTQPSDETATDHNGPIQARCDNIQRNPSIIIIKTEAIKQERSTESENLEIPLFSNEKCAPNISNVKTETIDDSTYASSALHTAPVSAVIKKEEIKTEISGGGNLRKRKKGLNF